MLRAFKSFVLLAVVTALGFGVAPANAAPPPVPYPVAYNFFSGIPNEVLHHGGSLPGANDWNCVPSAKHPNPVVLLHGTAGGGQINWGTYVPLLANEGYCVYTLTFGAYKDQPWPLSAIGGLRPAADDAAELAPFVDRVLATTHAAKVDFVSYSLGALVGQYYIKRLGGLGKVDKFVGIGPPWQGHEHRLVR